MTSGAVPRVLLAAGLLLVHGTASSPARRAEMLHDLLNDRALASRFRFWAFRYDTGNPIIDAAMLLRESLVDAIEEVRHTLLLHSTRACETSPCR